MRRTRLILALFSILLLTVLAYHFYSSYSLEHRFNNIQPAPVPLSTAVKLDLKTLDSLLILYYGFFAIHHDHWLNTEASMSKMRITLTGLPRSMSKGNLSMFPGIAEYESQVSNLKKRAEAKKVPLLIRLILMFSSPLELSYKPIDRGTGLRIDFPKSYTEESPPMRIASILQGAPACKLSLTSLFLNGDYDDPGDLDSFPLLLSGDFNNNAFTITKAGGILSTEKRVNALLKGCELYSQFVSTSQTMPFLPQGATEQDERKWADDWKRESETQMSYLANSEEEGREIMRVANDIWKSGVDQAQMRQDGQRIFYKGTPGWEDFGVIACYVRYGKQIFD